MTEKQIEEEVLRYLRDNTYNYAVLINGEWGSGKTYFANKKLTNSIVEQEKKLATNRTVKYISLYGCKDIESVQENIVWSFAEDARARVKDKASWGKQGEKISNNVLLSSKKIGNAALKKFLPEASLYEIATDWLNLRAFIFIFDDLERCECSLNEVFGFLNDLVEHEGTKVIIIANEEEISGVAKSKYLEMQYHLALNESIEWPKENQKENSYGQPENSKNISLDELERRRKLLFSDKDANMEYRRIREKLIGITLQYEPDIKHVIKKIIESYNGFSQVKNNLETYVNIFADMMNYYHHNNIRTFQFYISKIDYLLEKTEGIQIEEYYKKKVLDRIIREAFKYSIDFKANHEPEKRGYLLKFEQDTHSQVIKRYIESGNFVQSEYEKDVLTIQEEMKASIENDDPYYLLYQQYYYHEQSWCEEQLEKLILQLETNRYPVTFYGKIIIAVERLLELGFDKNYMQRIKNAIIQNLLSKEHLYKISEDLYFVEGDSKRNVAEVIEQINTTVMEHFKQISIGTVQECLNSLNWVERLEQYVNPFNARYFPDTAVFSKAKKEQWVNVIHSCSPEDIDDFRHWLSMLYPRAVKRESYVEDAETIKEICSRLAQVSESDLIKRASIQWLISQFEGIIQFQESVS